MSIIVDVNTWYTIQNVASGYYLGCGFDINGLAAVYLGNGEGKSGLWQFVPAMINGQIRFAMRPEAYGAAQVNSTSYCMQAGPCTSPPGYDCLLAHLVPCDGSSLSWQIGTDNASLAGYHALYTTNLGENSNNVGLYYLYNLPGGGQAGIENSLGTSDTGHAFWYISAAANINDATWSTYPPGVNAAFAGMTILSNGSTPTSTILAPAVTSIVYTTMYASATVTMTTSTPTPVSTLTSTSTPHLTLINNNTTPPPSGNTPMFTASISTTSTTFSSDAQETASPTHSSHWYQTRKGEIAGGALGGFVVLALVIGVIWYLVRLKRRQHQEDLRELETTYPNEELKGAWSVRHSEL